MDSFAFIIFGITGNLAQIKLIPALYDMAAKGALPANMKIVGNARKPMSQTEIEEFITKVLQTENKHHKHEIKDEIVKLLCSKISYIDGHLDDPQFYKKLKDYLEKLDPSGNGCKNKVYYLATYPELYESIFQGLAQNNLNSQSDGFVRLMIEKPIGVDLESARQLNALLLEYFSEDQVYRLDHYLGKETLQNILTFRFSNGIFEPILNKEHIDHIQITASEDFGVGKRGGYYDMVGSLRDVGQNHQLQMIAFALMDAPSEFNHASIARERLKILKALQSDPDHIVFGQYEGYLDEENIPQNSTTDTFYAFKTELNLERYKGVPVYVRAGKMMKQTFTEISIVFKKPTNNLFGHLDCGDEPTVLIYRIQPNEGIVIKILTKKFGSQDKLETNYMQYCYRSDPHDPHPYPDPYEKLIADAISGEQTFFNSSEEVEAAWEFIDPLFASKKGVSKYNKGTWGPEEADRLIEIDGRKWLEPSEEFCRI